MLNLPVRLTRAVFWLSLLGATVVCLMPVAHLPSMFNWWDKAQHALGFAALTGLGLLGYPAERWRVAAGLLLFGAFIELAQSATGWRRGDWLDWLADALGIVVVLVGMRLLPQNQPTPSHTGD